MSATNGMNYLVWIARFLWGSWFLIHGLNHWFHLFPQPLGRPGTLDAELLTALVNSGMFDIVKLIEIVGGICVLTGFYLPLALVAALPVSFGVFYWDVILNRSFGATLYGSLALGLNLFLCLAYFGYYKHMFVVRSHIAWPALPASAGAATKAAPAPAE